MPGLLRLVKGLICAALWAKLAPSYGPGETRGPAAQPCCAADVMQPWVWCLPAVIMQLLPSLLPPPPADLLEGGWFQQEATLAQRFFFLWLVSLVARFKY